jgi:hypothetical protein
MTNDTPNVYIANFGRANYEWPFCLERNTVATMIHAATKPFYDASDKNAFIDWCVANRKTASGITPTRAVASRWYGAMKTIESTEGDIWIHRQDAKLWWTVSKDTNPTWEEKESQDPAQKGNMTFVCHKPCETWSDKNKKGNPLTWNALHPKSKHFLSTVGTLKNLSDVYVQYAIALIEGDDLSFWENKKEWKEVAGKSKRSGVKTSSDWEVTVANIMRTVQNTVNNSNGQTIDKTVKNKELSFTNEELEEYINELNIFQEGRCNITDLEMQCSVSAENKEMIYSLDRIDSDGHYEKGNLQLVCRFVNRWKSDSKDSEFRNLINIVRDAA